MKRRVVEMGLVAVTLALTVSAVRRAAADELVSAPVPVPPAASRSAAAASVAALERARESVIGRNPFRVSRIRANVRVGQPPAPGATEQRAIVVAPARPGLIIRAIVGGPPWSALVDGLPNGQAGVVVKEGDVFGVLRIGVITRDTLAAIERDSVWKFAVHRNP